MIIKLQQQTLDKVKRVEMRVEKIESSVISSIAELKEIIREKEEKSFSLKESKYEVQANLVHFCN